eukprot:g3971.t1
MNVNYSDNTITIDPQQQMYEDPTKTRFVSTAAISLGAPAQDSLKDERSLKRIARSVNNHHIDKDVANHEDEEIAEHVLEDPSTETSHPSFETSDPSFETSDPSFETSHPSTETLDQSTEPSDQSTETSHPSTETSDPSFETSHPSTETSDQSTETSDQSIETSDQSTEKLPLSESFVKTMYGIGNVVGRTVRGGRIIALSWGATCYEGYPPPSDVGALTRNVNVNGGASSSMDMLKRLTLA